MLVIVSDLHLSDGSTGIPMPTSAFRLFQERLRNMAFDASKRSDPADPEDSLYQPIASFDLVLLGDIFDLIRSTQWTFESPGVPGYARPWTDPHDPAFVNKISSITQKILDHNVESCKLLRALAAGRAITIPAAAGKSRPIAGRKTYSRERVPVKANIYYLLGNHDWFFHLKEPGLDPARQKVIAALGLKNTSGQFPYLPAELPALAASFQAHKVFGRHGDHLDPFNFEKKLGRDHATLGDALVVELFNKIPLRVQEKLGSQLPPEVLEDLYELGSVRPNVMVPVWIANSLEKHQVPAALRKKITKIWQELLKEFLQCDFLKQQDTPYPLQTVDLLQALAGILQHISLDNLNWMAHYLDDVTKLAKPFLGSSQLAYEHAAMNEIAAQPAATRFIVYGHTHEFKVVPLRPAPVGQPGNDWIYVNSGTWHPAHDICLDKTRTGFISYKTMSYLTVYKGDERKGRSFETWSGTLDL